MKSFFMIFCALMLSVSLSSCKMENDNIKEQDQLEACRNPSYTNDSIDDFISDWQAAQIGKDTEYGLYGLYDFNNTFENNATLTVPVVQTQDFYLELIQILGTNILYFYIPPGDDLIISANTISICVFNEKNVYSKATEDYYKFRFFDNGNIAYEASQNAWCINNNGGLITIAFPEDIKLTSPEQISEYFTFETHTAGGGNDHIVS